MERRCDVVLFFELLVFWLFEGLVALFLSLFFLLNVVVVVVDVDVDVVVVF